MKFLGVLRVLFYGNVQTLKSMGCTEIRALFALDLV